MSNTIEEEILRKRTPILINSLNYILIFMTIVFIIIINFNSYSEYFEGLGRVVFRKGEYYIEIKTDLDNYEKLKNKTILEIEKLKYKYQIEEQYSKMNIDVDYNNHKIIYLKCELDDKYRINNYAIKVKINLGKKKLIDYIK